MQFTDGFQHMVYKGIYKMPRGPAGHALRNNQV